MEIRIEEIPAQPVAGITTRVKVSEIGHRVDELVPELAAALGDRIAGPLLARYHSWDDDGGEMELAFPVREPVEATGRVRPSELPAGRAVVADYFGSYDGLKEAWTETIRWAETEGAQVCAASWESYVGDCATTPPEKLLTRIVMPIR